MAFVALVSVLYVARSYLFVATPLAGLPPTFMPYVVLNGYVNVTAPVSINGAGPSIAMANFTLPNLGDVLFLNILYFFSAVNDYIQ